MMRWSVRIALWVVCGEWLLLFRFWMPPATFLALGLALCVRLSVVQALPHYAGHYYAWLAFLALFVWRFLRCFGKEQRRKREHYETPETGFTWLGKFLGVRPRRTAFGILVIEPALAGSIAALLAAFSSNVLVIPQDYFHAQVEAVASGMRGLSTSVQERIRGDMSPDVPWMAPSRGRPGRVSPRPTTTTQALRTPQEAEGMAMMHLGISIAALVVYNLTEWRSWYPRAARAKRARRKKPMGFPRVRMQRHAPPAVPTVMQMTRRLKKVQAA